MSTIWESGEDIQHAAQCLFKGVVPERASELDALWENYQLRFNLLTDNDPMGLFIVAGGVYRDVIFNHRAMRAFWFGSFIAWEGYVQSHKMSLEEDYDLSNFEKMIETFQRMLSESDVSSIQMPQGIPEPGIYPTKEGDEQHRAVAEIATIATGWVFLHEIRHIQHQQAGTSAAKDALPKEQHKEELSCDEFATKFILDNLDAYALTSEENLEHVKTKRELGIYFAMFVLTLVGENNWNSGISHPATQERIDAVIQHMGGNGQRKSDAIAHAAFGALGMIWKDAPCAFKPSAVN